MPLNKETKPNASLWTLPTNILHMTLDNLMMRLQ